MMNEKENELISLIEKVAKWIRVNKTPHTVVMIDGYNFRVMSDDFGAPLNDFIKKE